MHNQSTPIEEVREILALTPKEISEGAAITDPGKLEHWIDQNYIRIQCSFLRKNPVPTAEEQRQIKILNAFEAFFRHTDKHSRSNREENWAFHHLYGRVLDGIGVEAWQSRHININTDNLIQKVKRISIDNSLHSHILALTEQSLPLPLLNNCEKQLGKDLEPRLVSLILTYALHKSGIESAKGLDPEIIARLQFANILPVDSSPQFNKLCQILKLIQSYPRFATAKRRQAQLFNENFLIPFLELKERNPAELNSVEITTLNLLSSFIRFYIKGLNRVALLDVAQIYDELKNNPASISTEIQEKHTHLQSLAKLWKLTKITQNNPDNCRLEEALLPDFNISAEAEDQSLFIKELIENPGNIYEFMKSKKIDLQKWKSYESYCSHHTDHFLSSYIGLGSGLILEAVALYIGLYCTPFTPLTLGVFTMTATLGIIIILTSALFLYASITDISLEKKYTDMIKIAEESKVLVEENSYPNQR